MADRVGLQARFYQKSSQDGDRKYVLGPSLFFNKDGVLDTEPRHYW